MATHGRRTHQQWRTHQRRTHHFANASTPSLRRKGRNTGDWIKYKQLNYCFVAEKCMQRLHKKRMSTCSSVTSSEDKFHPGETRTSCVDPRGPPNATLTATLTVATSSLLPVLQGCLLIWLKFFQKCNYIIWNRFMFIFTFFYICLYIQVQVFPSLWRLQWHRMGVKGPGKIILDFCNFAKPVGIIKYNHPEKTWHCLCWFCLSNRFNAIHHSAGLERFGCPWVPWLSLGRVKNMDLITM